LISDASIEMCVHRSAYSLRFSVDDSFCQQVVQLENALALFLRLAGVPPCRDPHLHHRGEGAHVPNAASADSGAHATGRS
jgi:hypothetical protein